MDRANVTAAKPPASRWGRFLRDEDGNVIFFVTTIMLAMLMLAGMGFDLMRFETVRTELQQTADRSALAAASITQELDPELVARDYFAKMGLADKLRSVVVTNGLNFRNVRVEATAETNPIFLNLYMKRYVDEMEAKALSVAEQRITNVEIVLVLDVSGSMAGSKLSNLKTAAREFVQTVINADGEGRISIAIVPYNGQVNMPQYFQNLFTNRIGDHNVDNVNCFDLPESVYSGLGLPTNTALPVTGHVDTYSTISSSSSYVSTSSGAPNPGNRWCPVNSNNVILPPTNNVALLQSHIDNLQAIGATSINAGMKWGMTLLDPGSRDIIAQMVGQGRTPSQFAGRPYAYDDDEALKILVLMTDGEHFPEERLNDGYRTENSPIYRGSDGYYSIYLDRSSTSYDYWVPHRSEWRTAPWPDASHASRQTWDQVWAKLKMSWVARQLYARAYGNSNSVYNSTMNMFRTKTPVAAMNDQLQAVCSRARANQVIVYGIAFEAPTNGATQIENCATSTSHYFDAKGLEIQSVFRAIASNISQLKLTQ